MMNNKEDLIDFNSPKLLKPSDAVKYRKSCSRINQGNEQNCPNNGNSLVYLDNTFNLLEITTKSMIDGRNIEEKLDLSKIVDVSTETCDTTTNPSSLTAIQNNLTNETETKIEISSLKNNSSIGDSNIAKNTNQSIQKVTEDDNTFPADEMNFDSEVLISKDKVNEENVTNKEVDNKILVSPLNSPSKLNSRQVQCRPYKKEVTIENSTEEINSLKELILQMGNENKKLQENNLKYLQEIQQKSELLLEQTTVGQNLERENKNLIEEKQNLTEEKQNLSQELQTLLDGNKQNSGKKHISIEEDEKRLQDDKITLEESILKLEEEVLGQDQKIQKLIVENEKLEKNYEKLSFDSQSLLVELEKITEENNNTECKEMDYQQQHKNLTDKLESERANAEKYCVVLRDYEEYFNGLDEAYKELRVQIKQKNADLAILETAFRNTVEKFEKCKVTINSYSANEVIYQDNIKKLKDKLIEEHGKYNTLKEHAVKQFQEANKSFADCKNKCEEDARKQYANEKRLEIEYCSLDERVKQKKVECERLAKLCDEIKLGKV